MSRRSPRQDVCDQRGNRLHVRYYRRGGEYAFNVPACEPELEAQDSSPVLTGSETVEPHDQDHRAAHYLRILLDAYRPVLSEKQFEAAEQVIVLNRSLHEMAAARGGSVEAWRQRIEGSKGCGGLKDNAPELYALWIFRNRARRDIGEVINAISRAIHHRSSQADRESTSGKQR